MHSDGIGDDPFFEDDESDLAYDDGFGEAVRLGEADQISSSKRHEKTRLNALRKDAGKIVSSTRRLGGRHIERTALRQRVQNEAIRQARIRWERQFRTLIIRHWSPKYGTLDAALLAIMLNAFVSRAVALATEKVGDATSVEDAFSISSRALLASAVAAAARRTGRITEKQQEALTRTLYDGLDTAEKFIKIIVGGGSGETEDWEVLDDLATADADDFAWEDMPDGERVGGGRPATRGSGMPNDRRLAAQALRQGARYLLRMERRLSETGR